MADEMHASPCADAASTASCRLCQIRWEAGDEWLRDLCPDELFQPHVVLGLRRSLAFCPRHFRVLLAAPHSRIGMAQLVEDLLERAAYRGGRGPHSVEPCPACRRAERAWERAAAKLASHPDMALCLTDVIRVLPSAPRSLRMVLLDAAGRRLDACADDGAILRTIAGPDPDAQVRAVLRQDHAQEPMADATRRLVADLPRECCPLCLAGELAVARYSSWLLGLGRRELTFGDTRVCSAHAPDLAELDVSDQVSPVGEALRDDWASLLSAARGWDDTAQTGTTLPGEDGCRICRAQAKAEQRTEHILAAVLADSAGRALPIVGYGPCHRHVVQWADRRSMRLVRHLHADRLRLAGLDVQDEGRRLAWDHRYESAWPTPSASVRALSLVDGRVFLGREPPPDGHAPGPSPAVTVALDEPAETTGGRVPAAGGADP